jgi:hypothetical protein
MSKRIKPKWQIEKEKPRKNAKTSVNINASSAFKLLGDALSDIAENACKWGMKYQDAEDMANVLTFNPTQSKLDRLEVRQQEIEQQLNDTNMRLRQLELGIKSW